MQLHTRKLVPGGAQSIVCIHGVTQHGGVFKSLAEALEGGYQVVGIDLRGHGKSKREPPWDTATHTADVLETLDSLSLERATLVGHSFGGRIAAAVAANAPERVERIVLLDPAFEIPAAYALASAEVDRLDWTFASVESAVNALMSARSAVDVSRETVSAFAEDDLRPGPDGRLRFSYCPSAVVASWGEMARPAPPIAELRTLIIRPAASHLDSRAQDLRYRRELGSRLTVAAVPRGHNLLWESPSETAAIVRGFLSGP